MAYAIARVAHIMSTSPARVMGHRNPGRSWRSGRTREYTDYTALAFWLKFTESCRDAFSASHGFGVTSSSQASAQAFCDMT
eukprot:7312972-Alexandrium_andersonii.AAC.1